MWQRAIKGYFNVTNPNIPGWVKQNHEVKYPDGI
jgi:hypothetical protein